MITYTVLSLRTLCLNDQPTITPSPVGATSVAAAQSSTAVRAPSPRGAAASSSCSSYVWTISDLKTFDPSRGSIVLGKGSYGTVYLCRHRVTNQPIAIKTFTLPSCVQQMTKKVAEIQEEAALLDLFGREECFPTYLGCLEIGTGCVGLAMEFIGDAMTGETVTLHEAIRGAVPAITSSNWLRLALDICRGLELIHQRGYLMNDLKEDNVLLDKSSSGRWRARVIDLGMVSRQSSSSPYYFTSEEKARYLRGELYQHIAPEVAIQDQATDVLSDVYQVGRLMNMMGQAAGDGRLKLIGALCRNVCRASRPAVRDVVHELERML
ncbi:serine/threonine-protein kinase 4-like [Diadema setosum]|uniref:serine/threonine-protein kinase 4-like n=1 Tax=Diadema setosum TaxID=31175 RepID=UPI003B3AE8B5